MDNKQVDKKDEVLNREVTHMTKIIDVRSNEIMGIGRDIKYLNEIYNELASLVDSQGDQIDTISNHLEGSCENTKNGLDEIKKADKKQVKCLIQ